MDIVSKEQVIEFFDGLAEKWDDFAKNDESVTHDIIGNLGRLEKEFDIKTFISDERMIELIGIKK